MRASSQGSDSSPQIDRVLVAFACQEHGIARSRLLERDTEGLGTVHTHAVVTAEHAASLERAHLNGAGRLRPGLRCAGPRW